MRILLTEIFGDYDENALRAYLRVDINALLYYYIYKK